MPDSPTITPHANLRGNGMSEPSSHVTQLLERARHGDRHVVDELMPLIYDELRRLAQYYLTSERSGHTMQATALVNEAYVRLVGSRDEPWQNRAHFFAAAATAIRRILVQHARARNSAKRGGGWQRVELDPDATPVQAADERIEAVDDALCRLAEIDPRKARLVELRYFAGLTNEEASEVMNISPRTLAREWQSAKAWLSRELTELHGHEN